jgi:rubrerythrin
MTGKQDFDFLRDRHTQGNKSAMMYDFTAGDVFEMAEQMERNGANFYRRAAAKVSQAKVQTLLLDLARMEDDHLETFAALRQSMTQAQRQSTVFDSRDESALYLKALVDTRVFFKKKIDLDSLKEIFKAAIEAEKDSIVFYLGMREIVPDNLGKERIDTILKEEMSHIRLLSKQLAAVAS